MGALLRGVRVGVGQRQKAVKIDSPMRRVAREQRWEVVWVLVDICKGYSRIGPDIECREGHEMHHDAKTACQNSWRLASSDLGDPIGAEPANSISKLRRERE